MSLFSELKRRNVFRVGVAYLISAWIIAQVADLVLDGIKAPDWVMQSLFLMMGLGFIVALIISWAYEITPEGIKKESEVNHNDSISKLTAKKLDVVTLFGVVVVIVMILWQQFTPETINNNNNEENTSASQKTSVPSVIQSLSDSKSKNQHQKNNGIEGNRLIEEPESQKSIAALPFDNRSPDKNNTYFAEGIHDDLLTHLANFNAFKVISRTSVLEYKNTTKNIKQIGEELGVSNILEGAVQRSGNRVRINVQLIDAKTDKHLWAKIYDRKLTTDNLFDIQTEISIAIAVALKTTLAPDTIDQLTKAPTQNLQAYDLYLQARQFNYKNSASGYQTGIGLLQEAIKLDPQFQQAWISLANAQIGFFWNAQGTTSIRDDALQSLKQAQILDPESPDLARVYGLYYYWGLLDYPKALKYLNQALSKRTNDAEASAFKGWVLRRSGRWQEAIPPVQKSLELNPRAIINWSEIANTYTYLHRFSEALESIEKAQAIDSTYSWAIFYHANLVLFQNGNIKLAQSITKRFKFSHEREMIKQYILVQLLNKNYQQALNKVDEITNAEEIWRQSILLRDDLRAQIYFFQGELAKAKQAAQSTLESLNEKSKTLGDDYRLYLPKARMAAILGHTQKVKIFIEQSMQTSPTDAITQTDDLYEYARIFAMAGMLDETNKILEPQLSPPSFTSTNYVKIDPAFDKLRDNPEFKAMLARHPQQRNLIEEDVTR